MTQIIQSIYERMPSISDTKHLLTVEAKGTTFDLAINTLAQMALQRSFFPTLHPLRALVDITAMWFIQPIFSTLFLPYARSTFVSEFLSCVTTVYFIGAYRFNMDPSYVLTDLAALAIIPSLYLLESGVGSLATFLEQRAQDRLDRSLLKACQEENISEANAAFQQGANPSTVTREGFSYVSESFKSGNQQLILFMLEKTQSFDLFWKYILKQIEAQQEHFPNNIFWNWFDPFSNWGNFEGRIIFNLFKQDNIQLFEELWKHIPLNLEVKKNEILKLALRCGSAEISKFLMREDASVPELEEIKSKHNLTIHNFLPTFILPINGLAGFHGYGLEIVQDYLNLTHITSEQDLKNLTKIDHSILLNELEKNKCTLWEMTIYLSLIRAKEHLSWEDQFGLRPLDYAILVSDFLGNTFFDFLIKYDKSLITLGNHHTCFHLAILTKKFDLLPKLLKTINESVVPLRKKSSLILRELSGKNVQHQLPWVIKELVNRPDIFGLPPLHHTLTLHSPNIPLATIDILLKAGAKDITGFFVTSPNSSPQSSFMKRKMLAEDPQIGEFKTIALTASELIEKTKEFADEWGIGNNLDKCLQLLNEEKTYEELMRS